MPFAAQFVYGLFYCDPQRPKEPRFFYVGRTSKNVEERILEHRREQKSGRQPRHEFMRKLAARGIPWHWELVGFYRGPFSSEGAITEALLAQGHPLKISRAGDSGDALLPSRAIVRQYLAMGDRNKEAFLRSLLAGHGIPDIRSSPFLSQEFRELAKRRGVGDMPPGSSLEDLLERVNGTPCLSSCAPPGSAYRSGEIGRPAAADFIDMRWLPEAPPRKAPVSQRARRRRSSG